MLHLVSRPHRRLGPRASPTVHPMRARYRRARYFKAGLEDRPVPCITVQASRSVLPLPAIGRNRATRRRRRIPLVGMDVALVLRFLATAEHPAHALPRPWTPLLVELQRRALRRALRQLLRPGPTSPPYVARYTSD